uniref:Uncharacterized protein n=1 Tax=Candidatus Kentrum sp. FW TaxID=2126338 RepID=A0A450U2W0_9GAMM|nr:MAG: hypothetical protein BECKFW1821C_GA0114237_112411 [Candidatus Kentron sp. FW]
MRENCTSGSVRGVPGNGHSYRKHHQRAPGDEEDGGKDAEERPEVQGVGEGIGWHGSSFCRYRCLSGDGGVGPVQAKTCRISYQRALHMANTIWLECPASLTRAWERQILRKGAFWLLPKPGAWGE